jgi:hypothetical protein
MAIGVRRDKRSSDDRCVGSSEGGRDEVVVVSCFLLNNDKGFLWANVRSCQSEYLGEYAHTC